MLEKNILFSLVWATSPKVMLQPEDPEILVYFSDANLPTLLNYDHVCDGSIPFILFGELVEWHKAWVYSSSFVFETALDLLDIH